MAQAEREQPRTTKNPLILVSLIVIGLIVFIFTASDRKGVDSEPVQLAPQQAIPQEDTTSDGQISRESLAPPGMRARDQIRQLREQGKPYPFDHLMAKASAYASEGSLADAHLMFFFAAREGHVEAMMMMAEMSDPTLFRADNNLLDRADAIQAFKWYQQALEAGFEPARMRLDNLKSWAEAEANYGNSAAQQLLLNFN